ncbi:MAG: DUF4838 domain-containing protein [Candidatus Saccharicenans sp.]|uniref:DUF4838 domain-containing protein n=1 Tax=Candidatus Saccharicenans sp. TaxID=2819258 RepID=UPI004049780A
MNKKIKIGSQLSFRPFKRCLLILAAFFTFFFPLLKAEAQVTLVKNKKSSYRIVLQAHPSPEEKRAAEFFNQHLQKISGLTLPVISTDKPEGKYLVIIQKSSELPQPDDFRVFTHGQHLYILGGQGKGCVYGVAEILERYFGIRYYSPDYVVIPQESTLILPVLNFSGHSPNIYRNVNGQFSQDPDYRDFHRLHTVEDMFARGYYVHTFQKLIPWQEYFREQPEYFAWLNDKRVIDQLCPSNPEVKELIIRKLEQEMKAQPEKKVWSLSQNDNFSYCQCENCQKIIEEEGSPSGPILRLVNAVAAHFPDKIISILAYQFSRQAPKITRPAANVQIMLCTIELNRSQPIAEDQSSLSFIQDLKDWSALTENIYLWDYTVNFAHSLSPFPNLHTLKPNIKLFMRYGVRQHFQQSNTGTGHEFSELKNHLLARLLWNPEADVDSLIKEFTDGYYGPAAPWIRRYLYHLQSEILKTGEWLDIYGPPNNHQDTFLSAENIRAYNEYFDRAEEAVAGQPDYLLHVRTARMALQYAEMEIAKADMFGPRGWYQEINGEFVPKPHLINSLEKFYDTAAKVKAAPVNESGLTCEEYYRLTRRFLETQVKGNLAFRKKVAASPLPAAKYSGGNLDLLTNGVRGANDYKVHWLGWEGQNFELLLDLEKTVEASVIEISTLWDAKSWILHPVSVSCYVSKDGINFELIGSQKYAEDQRQAEVSKIWSFQAGDRQFRLVRFEVQGTLKLYDWHPSAGGKYWVFVDEIVVR